MHTRTRMNEPTPRTGRSDEENGSWKTEQDPMGWLTFWKPLPPQEKEPALLSIHGDWAGPVKVLDFGQGRIQRTDLYPGEGAFTAADPMFDEEGVRATERLINALNARAEEWFAGNSLIAEWNPPSSKTLRKWLVQAGLDTAIDGEDNLRMTLKRRGLDGQVRVSRREGRLRFTMPLWQGRRLDPVADAAMTRLAAEANARCKLARIARLQEKEQVRFEAQVDLSGLPWLEEPDGPTLTLWQGMIRMTALSLDLALRRLGLELPLLAGGHHAVLAHWIMNKPRAQAASSSAKTEHRPHGGSEKQTPDRGIRSVRGPFTFWR